MRTRYKPTTLPIGSISSGTMREVDLIPSYLDAADSIRLTAAERKQVQGIRKEFDGLPLDDADWTDEQQEQVGYMLEELSDILSSHTPDFCYFGSHPGDGADYGVWPVLDEDMEDNGVFRSSFNPGDSGAGEERQRAFEAGASHWLHVNDHGNATLYRRAGNRWIEVWSIV
jgi:hypothetical protein